MRQKYPTAYVTQLAKPTTEEAAEIAKLKANIDTLMQEQLAAFIMNGITDEGWEEFMAKLNNAGIERYIEIYQGVFDKYMGN